MSALIENALKSNDNEWINSPDSDGHTPLFYLIDCTLRQPQLIKYVQQLILLGASIDTQNKDGITALMLAAFNREHTIVQLLLDKGASIDTQNKDGITALMLAAEKGYTAIVKLLLDKGASIDTQNNYGNTALMLAAYYDNNIVVKQLLEYDIYGASIDTQNKDGITALMLAAEKGYTAIVKLLLDKGASIDTQNKNRNTALMLAAGKGYTAIVQLLLDKGASIDTQNKNRSTALMLAALNRQHEIVKILIDAKKSRLLPKEHDMLLQTLHLPTPAATNRMLPTKQYDSYFILSHGSENIINFSERKYRVPPKTYIVTFTSTGCLTYFRNIIDRLLNTPIDLADFPSARIYRPGFKFPVLLASFDHSEYEIKSSQYYRWGVYKDTVPNPLYTKEQVAYNASSLFNPEKGKHYDVFNLITDPSLIKTNSNPDAIKVYFYTGCRETQYPVTETKMREIRDRSYSQQGKNSQYSDYPESLSGGKASRARRQKVRIKRNKTVF
jgi:ankyrin repeat protein